MAFNLGGGFGGGLLRIMGGDNIRPREPHLPGAHMISSSPGRIGTPRMPTAPRIAPEQHAGLQNHPAVQAMRQIQDEWRRTGIKDPRIDAYTNAHATALSQGLEPAHAVMFAASAATGRF